MFQKERFRPLGDRVLVKRLDSEEKTTSGLYIPDAAKEKPQKGIIIAVGTGKTHEGTTTPLTVKTDDIVFFGKYSGTDAGDDYLIMREDEILGIVER